GRKAVFRAGGVAHQEPHIDQAPAQRHMIDALRLAESAEPALEELVYLGLAIGPPGLEARGRHPQEQRLVRVAQRQRGERTVGKEALQDLVRALAAVEHGVLPADLVTLKLAPGKFHNIGGASKSPARVTAHRSSASEESPPPQGPITR